MRDIVVVGSLNVDVSLQAEHLPRAGETVRGQHSNVGPGGKGLNQAIASARLGGRVHLVGRVGDDRFAEIPLEALRSAGVDDTYVQPIEDCATGLALIIVDRETGENQIATAAGANQRVEPAAVLDALAAFRASAVLLIQLEVPLVSVAAALEQARAQRLKTVLDPAPAMELPDELLRRVDILTPNESEASLLSGVEVDGIESAAAAGARLRERTQGDVIVTLGSAGCVWAQTTGFEYLPAPRVTALDSTGAGDAFNGGLAVALASGAPLASALRQALLAGSAATLARGAAEAMPTPLQLAALEA